MVTYEPPADERTYELPLPGRCRAKTQAGRPCRAWPIQGGTVCNKHGGSAPQVRAAADRRIETEKINIEAARLMDLDGVDLHPVEHLLEELHRAAAVVRVLGGHLAEVEIVSDRGTHPLYRLWSDERDRRAQLASLAMRAGAEERRVRLAEERGAQVAEVIVAALMDLGVDPHQLHVRQVIAGHLRAAAQKEIDR